ncbi:tetratricopeptide repeat protein [Comamonadaceae bacterium G21597-S1]|nr:tetratricopeptide repeat protein [Comamonadaceae bacterium G21597-S1]
MMHPGSGFGQCIRLFCLAALFAFATSPARADNYAPVNQLLRDGQLSEAMVKAEQYLATNPRDPQMRFLKGLIQQDGGQREAAIITYESLIQDYPELPEPYNNVAVLYASQGRFEKAREALEMATRNSRSYAIAHENLGDVYARLASEAYRQAIQLDAGNTTVGPKLALIRQLINNPAANRLAPFPGPTTPPATPAKR